MEDLQIAFSEKCPLCGGDVILGECSSCGYKIPDTEELSAVYDLSPDNVIFSGEPNAEDLIPAIDLPDISSLPTAKQRRYAARLKKSETEISSGSTNSAKAANTAFVPYTKPNYGNPPESDDTLDAPTRLVKSVSDFVFYNWWKFMLTAIIPSLGYGFAFFYFVINMDKERKKSELVFAAAILLTTILLQAVKWDPTGFDIRIQYFIKGFLTRGRHYY